LLSGIAGLQAQSSDALLNKLVQKGILTSREADEIREEAKKDPATDFAKLDQPDLVTSVKFGGDFRAPYDAGTLGRLRSGTA
jgi:hypothetical protein